MRRVKTARERAAEALGVAQRRVDRLAGQRNDAKGVLVALEAYLAEAQVRLDYAAQDPALPRAEKPKAVAS